MSNSHRSTLNPQRATHAPRAMSSRHQSTANPQGAPRASKVESARGDHYCFRGYTVRRATSGPLRALPQEQGVRVVRVIAIPYHIQQQRLVHVADNSISSPATGEGQWNPSQTLETFEGHGGAASKFHSPDASAESPNGSSIIKPGAPGSGDSGHSSSRQ